MSLQDRSNWGARHQWQPGPGWLGREVGGAADEGLVGMVPPRGLDAVIDLAGMFRSLDTQRFRVVVAAFGGGSPQMDHCSIAREFSHWVDVYVREKPVGRTWPIRE